MQQSLPPLQYFCIELGYIITLKQYLAYSSFKLSNHKEINYSKQQSYSSEYICSNTEQCVARLSAVKNPYNSEHYTEYSIFMPSYKQTNKG